MGKTNLFVYGTLKRGFRNHAFLKDQEFRGEARTEPRYRLLDLGTYPGLEEANDGDSILGEVYAVDTEILADLDRFEEVPTIFARRPVALVGWNDVVHAYFAVARDNLARDT